MRPEIDDSITLSPHLGFATSVLPENFIDFLHIFGGENLAGFPRLGTEMNADQAPAQSTARYHVVECGGAELGRRELGANW